MYNFAKRLDERYFLLGKSNTDLNKKKWGGGQSLRARSVMKLLRERERGGGRARERETYVSV